MKLINFHTHKPELSPNAVCVYPINVELDTIFPKEGFITIGVHPWHTNSENINLRFEPLKKALKQTNVIGIGEIGLDRLKGASLIKQTEILEYQLDISIETNKPVILHCVRSWSELVTAMSKKKYKNIAKAIHGFIAKPEIATMLVSQNYYLSFGSAIINATPELAEALTLVPRNRLFLETDDSDIPIYEVYDAASDILDTTIEELVQLSHSNFYNFFGIVPE